MVIGLRRLLPLTFLLLLPLSAQDAPGADPKERARAARELGKHGSESIPALRPMLADPEIGVRLEAVKSIVAIGTRHSLDPLIEATRDNDPEIQIWATDGLVNFYLPGYVQTGLTARLRRIGSGIRARFTDVNDQVIDAHIVVRPEVGEAVGKLARGGIGMEVRANAARAAGVLRARNTVPDLLEAARSKDTQVIYETLVALQKIRDPEAAPGIAFLLRDLDEKVRIAAIETTGLLQNKAALPDLREAFQRSRSQKVQRAALVAIAMLPDESSRSLFESYLNSRDEHLRAAAAEGIGRLRRAEDRAAMEQLFGGERSMHARLSQAFALVLLGRHEVAAFSPLLYLVNTLNSRGYQGVAQPFLVELSREAEVRRHLHEALPGGTKEEKIQLAMILGRSGDQSTVEPLEKLTRDGDADVAREALRALRTLRARLP